VIAERLVLDTDVVSGILRGTLDGDIGERLTGAIVLVTFVTVGELFRGAEHARWGAKRRETLRSWLDAVPTVPADAAIARRWGAITGSALREGRPLPANDAWIAACCLAHGLALATGNVRDFAAIRGLELVTRGA
jgi:predicted nucleic acid-binding protein